MGTQLNSLCITWQEHKRQCIRPFCVHTFESSVLCHTERCLVMWNGSRGTNVCGWKGSYQNIAEERVSTCWKKAFKSLLRSDKLWRLMVWLNLQRMAKTSRVYWICPKPPVHSSINNWSYHLAHIQEGGGCCIQKKTISYIHIFHTYRAAAGITVALHVVGIPALLHQHNRDSLHVSLYKWTVWGVSGGIVICN